MNKTSLYQRREWLIGAAAASTAGLTSGFAGHQNSVEDDEAIPDEDYRIVNGRAKQSVMAWCFNPMPMEQFIPACGKMGLVAMEGIDPKHYPLMKQHGLGVSLCGSHGFKQGPYSKSNHEIVEILPRRTIERD